MEVGMGLHGEPGASTQKMQSANDIVKQVKLLRIAFLQSLLEACLPVDWLHLVVLNVRGTGSSCSAIAVAS